MKMMTNSPVQPFEVRHLSFAYEDDPSKAKERPVIVAHVSGDEALVMVVKVTGHGPRPDFAGEVRLVDWEEAGLTKPSVARCSKTAVVPVPLIVAASLYGRLSPRDEDAVVRGLHEAGMV